MPKKLKMPSKYSLLICATLWPVPNKNDDKRPTCHHVRRQLCSPLRSTTGSFTSALGSSNTMACLCSLLCFFPSLEQTFQRSKPACLLSYIDTVLRLRLMARSCVKVLMFYLLHVHAHFDHSSPMRRWRMKRPCHPEKARQLTTPTSRCSPKSQINRSL